MSSFSFYEEEFGPDIKTNGKGANGGTESAAFSTEPWPILNPVAYHGIAGEVVDTIAPQTEADPVALLLQILAFAGNVIGRRPYYQINQSRHFTNIYGVLAGETSKARKGLSESLARALFEAVDGFWVNQRSGNGMSSGEGILEPIRDASYIVKKGVRELAVEGVEDKRLMITETEFASVLDVMKRDGNTLSRFIRDAWDCPPVLRTMTKNNPLRATNPFISVIGHISIQELRKKLDENSMMNGFANRFLFACVHRSQELPFGGDIVEMADLGGRMQAAIDRIRAVERVRMTENAAALWRDVYSTLSAGRPGLLGGITARAEAQTVRLALIYALLDGASEIDRVHLEAAMALWAFCDASAHFIFSDIADEELAGKILAHLQEANPEGMSRNEISQLLNRNTPAEAITLALKFLSAHGKARQERGQSGRQGGRRREIWFAV